MYLSIILLTWNSCKDIPNCLDSIIKATEDIKREIIVVDNGSIDGSQKLLANYPVKLITLDRNLGVAKARNIAISHAIGEYVWILDIDTIVNATALRGMLEFMEQNPACGLCTCRLTSPDGCTQDSCRRYPWFHYKIINFLSSKFNLKFLNKIQEYQFYRKEISGNRPFKIEYAIGACQIITRNLINKIGPLDEAIFYGPEDANYCWRINRKNYYVCCLPQYSIIHDYKRLVLKKFFSRSTYHHIMGLIYFHLRYIYLPIKEKFKF